MIEIINFLAILLGPIIAVFITRWRDNVRLKYERQMNVFRTLMRTRRLRLNPDHVGALNLVEVEFFNDSKVIDAWKKYLNLLGTKYREDHSDKDWEEVLREGDTLLTKLLHAIAKSLKFEIEQLDIFEGGYTPQGWWTDELQQRKLISLFIDLLQGRLGVPIIPYYPGISPFPPPPKG